MRILLTCTCFEITGDNLPHKRGTVAHLSPVIAHGPSPKVMLKVEAEHNSRQPFPF